MDQQLLNSSSIKNLSLFSYIEKLKDSFSPMTPIDTGFKPFFPAEPFPVKAVLLDIYGTLLISEAGDIGLTSPNQASSSPAVIFLNDEKQEHSYPHILQILHDLIRKNHTITKQRNQTIQFPEVDIISIWEQLYHFLGIREIRIEDLIQTALHFEIQTNKIGLMPHARELLSGLKKLGIPVGIVSNAQFYTPLFMEYFLGDSLASFDVKEEISSWSYKISCGKPDLQIFTSPLETLQKELGISASETLYIGNDMLNDIYTAHSCGLKTALFAGDKRSLRIREDNIKVSDLKADCLITDLLQIIPFIQETKL